METDQQSTRHVTDPCEAITSRLFEAYLKCPTKCFLQSIAETGHGNAYADWVRAQNESYRRAGVKRLMDKYPNGDCTVGPLDNENLRTAKWKIVADLATRSRNLESTIHAVERIPSEGRGQATQFIPIRFVPTNKLAKDDKLLLTFDALVLSEALGQEIALGRIIHGDDRTTFKIKTQALVSDVRKIIEKISALLPNPAPPNLVLNRHCAECEFRDLCRPKAIEKDDLSLISGLPQKEILKLNKKGIFSVTQLSHTYRPIRRRSKIKTADKHSHALKALAIREKKIYVTETDKPKVGRVQVFFDVEGVPDRDFYYLIGAKVVEGTGTRTHSFWADDRAGEERMWKDFLSMLSAFDSFSLFHFGGYDSEFIARMLKKHGTVPGIPPDHLKAGLINVLTYCYLNIYFPTYSNGLKEIATYLKFQWGSPGSSGLDSIDWRHQWEVSKDDSLKQKLVRYNLDDCEALKILTDALMEILTPGMENQDSVIAASSIPVASPYKLGPTSFVVPEFAYINKCAYFNYQRSKVYWRTDTNIKRNLKRVVSQRRRHQRINKVVYFKTPKNCPACRSRKVHNNHNSERVIYDLQFSSTGVKKWITKLVTAYFKCRQCQKYFLPNEYVAAVGRIMGHNLTVDQTTPALSGRLRESHFGNMQKYGHGLLAWTIYQNIGQRQTGKNVARSLNDIFGFGFDPSNSGLVSNFVSAVV